MSFNKNTDMYEGYIYLITNKINGKGYIGQTNRTVLFRFQQHKYRSTQAKYTQPLYNAFKKYGLENFCVEEVLKIECTNKKELSKELNSQEILYIEKYNSKIPYGYNVLNGGNQNPTELTSIKVYAFDSNQKLKMVFNSKSEALRFIGVSNFPKYKIDYNTKYKDFYWSYSNNFPTLEVPKHTRKKIQLKPILINKLDSNGKIIEVCNARNFSGEHYKRFHDWKVFYYLNEFWSFSNDITEDDIKECLERKKLIKENANKIIKNKNSKEVYQFSLDGKFIKKWDSQSCVQRELNINATLISNVCSGKADQTHGYLWSYTNTPPSYKSRDEKLGKSVIQYDINMNKINHYKTLAEAQRETNIPYQSISDACKGIYKQAGGFIWKYAS